MMRLWAKGVRNGKIVFDTIVENNDSELSRTKKIFSLLNTVCHDWDLSVPVWLDSNIHDFKYHSKTRFLPDNFMDSVNFDYLEIQVVEE